MLYQELIRWKRDGGALTPPQIAALVAGITDGSLGDAQLGALAMAIVLRGMDLTERVALTLAMRDSGQVLHWDRGPVLDKHSTGGIGDNVSLMLAPALAACGAIVPMISGRGLGHTGGTLDKLSAIPGYDMAPGAERLRAVIATVGCAIIGQTADLAPADRRFYAVRDVTATVESLDLITASILSKKLAAGLQALVLDVKVGTGAFMSDMAQARALAGALVQVAQSAGCRTVALITDMNQPLASAAGNALELRNAVDFLTGHAIDPRLWDVTCALGAEGLVQAGLAADPTAGRGMIEGAFTSGRAAERFAQMVAALGGPHDVLRMGHMMGAQAPVTRDVAAPHAGVITGYDTRAIGLAVIEMGGGRRQPGDRIDPSVGFDAILPIGTQVDAGTPLARAHAADTAQADRAARDFIAACQIGTERALTPSTIIEAVRN